VRDNLPAAIRRLIVFVAVCATFIFAMFAVFAQLRFNPERMFNAEFQNVSGLEKGQFVRIAGVEVGKVKDITLNPDMTASVAFSVDDSMVLTEGTRAAIRYDDLIGGRYLALEEGAGSTSQLKPGGTIPVSLTSPALDLDALIGGFRPLFRALDPDQVNALSGQLIAAFQGEGSTVQSLLSNIASLTNTLADRDELIGHVVDNLNIVLGSLGSQSQQFDTAVMSLSQLVDGLNAHKQGIADSIASMNGAAVGVADLLAQSRPPLQKVVHEADRTAGLVVADHDYVDNLLATLPDAYRLLNRQGLYGDFFSFYLCDIILKVNGKGGQPVYIKLAGQDTGRCTPK